MTTRWIVHAEGKAALMLASAGVTGGILFSIVQGVRRLDPVIASAAGACGLLTFAAGLFAAISLWSRLRSEEEPMSPLFFHHIARGNPSSADRYAESLSALIRDPTASTIEIAHQVWANAHVARRKFHWVNLGLASLFGGFLMLGITCMLLVVLG